MTGDFGVAAQLTRTMSKRNTVVVVFKIVLILLCHIIYEVRSRNMVLKS